MSTNLSLGERLKKRRSEVGLLLREFARRTELIAAFLSQIERGISNPSLNSLRRIANAQNVPLLYFLADKDDRSLAVWANNRRRSTWTNPTSPMNCFLPTCLANSRPFKGSLLVGLIDQDYILHTGDTITFQGKDIVKLVCDSNQEVQWISVITSPVF